ncbi:hypothetical protein NKH86_21835 [Mesorhizobium sp. M0913]|uniref:hypothetical protein n=1 Tax=Mesorhizobium sp. M0913 TaxID=2957026 RepID=UPI00333AFCF2
MEIKPFKLVAVATDNKLARIVFAVSIRRVTRRMDTLCAHARRDTPSGVGV